MTGVPCALMRGGTSKGAVFLADDLPSDPVARDALLLRIMGSPDVRQIDGLGGAHPLTSKVAVVSAATDDDADLDYLFLQVAVDEAVVSASQTCGNMLATVLPFAVTRQLFPAGDPHTVARVRFVNTGDIARIRVDTPGGEVTYDGSTRISGVPGSAAPVVVSLARAGRPLLPTGRPIDVVDGLQATLVDAGMPSVLVRADDLGVSGDERPADLETAARLTDRVARIRAEAFALMGLTGRPETTTTPKIVLLSAPKEGGVISTRSFIPHRVHQAIGVLGAASVAAAVRTPGTVAAQLARSPDRGEELRIEHPTGFLGLYVESVPEEAGVVRSIEVVRTARLIMSGTVYPAPLRTTDTKGHSS
ncbi:4-oxalomesaconate tautomerase [Branchiibius hedensis]|uniref:4-oxalomesaconate tautomerase n=1 Tax=Branchiibius hedensis TaxID=672460 RepID=A0A2Y8ZVT4_9MICO|nr:PrpF domain-containing protein [Branchiibius hedensis]PWJ26835.1 4-oxalomesaconate tautomerase [Branchiibius hedensis]SSA35646.1 4-oxalomesaconate tautomerase [Branchiibius hedensis]